MLGAPTGVRGRAPLTHLGGAQRRGAGARATELERGAPGVGSSEDPPVPIGGNGRGRAEGQTQPPSRAREHLYSRQPASAHWQPSGAGKMENVQPSTQPEPARALAACARRVGRQCRDVRPNVSAKSAATGGRWVGLGLLATKPWQPANPPSTEHAAPRAPHARRGAGQRADASRRGLERACARRIGKAAYTSRLCPPIHN